MTRTLLAASVIATLAIVGCAGNDGTGTPSPAPSTTTPDPTPSGDPNAPLDSSADPVPAGIPVLRAFDKAAGAEVAVDLSCAGKPLPVSRGPATDREFHLINLGGQDIDRAGDAKVDIFLDNKFEMPADATVQVKKTDDPTTSGVFTTKAQPGWIAFRAVPSGTSAYLPIIGLDLEVPDTGAVLPTLPTQEKVNMMSILIGGSDYEASKGSGRAVVRVVDCQGRPMVNTHVVLEIDGKVGKPAKTDGLRRSYFSDTEFPSMSTTWTSRSGVVAFIEIPAGAKSIRAVARGIVDGQTKVIGLRPMPLVADGVTTAKLFPYAAQ